MTEEGAVVSSGPYEAVGAQPSELPAPAPVEFLPTDVGEIAVRRTPVQGSGPHEPAVLVHGLGGNSLNWVDLAEMLSDRLECVSPDLPGFGATVPLADGDFSIAAHSRAMVATIEALFPGQAVHLFGNSMGGAVAVQVAALRPDLVRTLTLISPALPDLKPRLTNVHIPVMAMPGVGKGLFDRYQKVGAHERVKATFDLCFADPSRLHPQRRAEAEEEARRRDELPWLRETFVGSTQSLLATLPGPGAGSAVGARGAGRGADAAGLRAPGQARGPEGGAPGDQGVPGGARDGHPGLGARGADGAPGAGGPVVAGVPGVRGWGGRTELRRSACCRSGVWAPMGVVDALGALVLARSALYVLGLPVALLLPAPETSQWIHRIAIAPAYSIGLAAAAAWLLRVAGVALHPAQLVLVGALLWAVAWRYSRQRWRLREAFQEAAAPAILIAMGGLTWLLSLVGYGLYLPNRDFKNHAYLVAQIAWTRSADYSIAFRASPVSEPSPGGFYPLGLHTLLGWALPSTGGSTVALTAASAILVTAISTPLAFVTLARMWDSSNPRLWWAVGAVGVFMPGLTGTFKIGSVVLLVGASLYAAGLGACWLWVRGPSWGASIGLGLAGSGLFALHVAEAVGLGLVTLACLPGMFLRRGGVHDRRVALFVLLGACLAAVVAWRPFRSLSGTLGSGFAWDIQPNEDDPLTAILVALVQQPGGMPVIALAWVGLGLVGFWLAHVRRMSLFPLIAFLVPLALGALTSMRGVPLWLNVITAPWYGSASRVGLMAAASIALAAGLAVVTFVEAPRGTSVRALASIVGLSLVASLAAQLVPARRGDLSSSLAGAGDTGTVADLLASRLRPGQTVLNLEGDGTAALFAYSRIPVLSGLGLDESVAGDGALALDPLTHELLRLADPEVSRRMREANVAFVALGTTSRYWGSEVGYAWQEVLSQQEVQLELQGSDVTILRYVGSR